MILGEPVSYFLFELLVLALFTVCLVYSLRGRGLPKVSRVLELLVFVLYGFGLEGVAVNAGFYTYAPFTFSLWHTPLVIAVGWAVIGSSVMGFSDSLNMSQWSKPFLDALLALLIDLGMDAVAIRDRYLFDNEVMGMWNWPIALDEQWFGVPYANFMAWWLVVFVMSSALRGGRYIYGWFEKRWLAWAYPLGAFAVALSVFLVLLLSFGPAFDGTILLCLLGLSGLVTFLGLKGRQTRLSWRENAPVFAVPLAFHLFFLSLMLWRGLYVASPGVLGVSLFALVLHEALLLFTAGWRTRRVPKLERT